MIDPAVQKKIDKMLALAERAGTADEAKVARNMANYLKEKYTIPDPKPNPIIVDDLDGAMDLGFFFKEDGKETEI